MRKIYLILIVLIILSVASFSQVVNKIRIFPSQPTANDSISIISDFSYIGTCSFGMVYMFTNIHDSIIELHPTYCGYWDSTSCNSIDTFKIGKFSAANYKLKIVYHQGSVCPISNFDAVIAQFDSTLSVGIVGISQNVEAFSSIKLFPNPTSGKIVVSNENIEIKNVEIYNIYGEKVKCISFSNNQKSTELDVSELSKGLYIFKFSDGLKVYYKSAVIQ